MSNSNKRKKFRLLFSLSCFIWHFIFNICKPKSLSMTTNRPFKTYKKGLPQYYFHNKNNNKTCLKPLRQAQLKRGNTFYLFVAMNSWEQTVDEILIQVTILAHFVNCVPLSR